MGVLTAASHCLSTAITDWWTTLMVVSGGIRFIS